MTFGQDTTFHVREQPNRQLRLTATVTRQAAGTSVRNTLNLNSPAARIEVEDAYFNHNSAVMMPDTVINRRAAATQPFHAGDPEHMAGLQRFHPTVHTAFTVDPPDPGGEPRREVNGLGVLAATYRFLALNPSFRLLLAGHCDTTGQDDFNFTLSEQRAKNVLLLLTGDRQGWIAIALAHSQVEDQKRICRHAARERGWPCDPGPINNVADADLTRALRALREHFNQDFGRSIPLDGPAGPQTWGAFFDIYMDELAGMLGTTVDRLDAHRAELRFVDKSRQFIACGEKLPIEEQGRDEFRSEANRRVEILFFSTKALPDFHCHTAVHPFCMRSCPRNECGVYAPELFFFVAVDPSLLTAPQQSTLTERPFQIVDTVADLDALADKPDDSYVTRTTIRDVDDSVDPWAFIEPFMNLDPEHTLHETDPFDDEGGAS